jgi:DNA-binding transcriptional ArsR family regulator
MDLELAAQRLGELGHGTRLAVFRHLVRCGPRGCRVGDVQQMLGIPASTLSHHIGRLVSVGLVKQQRDGRILYCRPNIDAFNETIGYLTEECCRESGDLDSACVPATPKASCESGRGVSE